jgi:VIT1/CCC1 family predicted Fe2+/Mn2+ transporter
MVETRRSTLLAFVHSLGSTVGIVAPFIILDLMYAVITSLVVALTLLFLLGAAVGKFSYASPWKYGVRYVLLGSTGAILAFAVGAAVGSALAFVPLSL